MFLGSNCLTLTTISHSLHPNLGLNMGRAFRAIPTWAPATRWPVPAHFEELRFLYCTSYIRPELEAKGPETLRICDSWGLIHPAFGRVFNHSNLSQWGFGVQNFLPSLKFGLKKGGLQWDRSGMSQRWTLIPNAAVNRPEGQWNDKIFAVLSCMSIKFHACRCEACPRQPRQIKTSLKSLCSVKHAT